MTLLTAHRILIGTAVAFFVFYGVWEIAQMRAGGGMGGMVRGAISFLAAAGLGLYLTSLRGRRID
jgi:hypothetical protein